jgi:hypothetical protein
MHAIMLVLLGTLAAVGLLTLIAIGTVIKFGDNELTKFRSW